MRLLLAYTVYCPMIRHEFDVLFDHLFGGTEEKHKNVRALGIAALLSYN
jgi:hypothetical protein